MDYDYFWDDGPVDEEFNEEPEDRPRDKKVDDAKEELKSLFGENNTNVYYIQQLEVLFEKKYFHWITFKAVDELIKEKVLKFEEMPLRGKTHIKFVFNKGYRYPKRQMNEKLAIVRDYSEPDVSAGCGRQAEVLFFNGIVNRGFLSRGQNTRTYGDNTWTRSDHNLDFIIEKDGRVYGAEVKNKWGYIDKGELEIKLELCGHLGIIPLFIMRGSPKSYNWLIQKAGGFALIFEAQIYPYGHKELVNRIGKVLGLSADSPREIPSGIIDRFIRWHEERVKGELPG